MKKDLHQDLSRFSSSKHVVQGTFAAERRLKNEVNMLDLCTYVCTCMKVPTKARNLISAGIFKLLRAQELIPRT
jgi:hypothetical protein